ncbi:MAG TPA: HD family phosphohydrolase, partial [Syntrophobacteria bacterium]|nr:HD family phosphohydrolase [Syntrophobacteria bacterium]
NEAGILSSLPHREREIIVQSVKFHNTYSLPDLENEEVLLFLRLIRDADKLDIWRVFIEYYETPVEDRPSAVGLGLSDSSEYSGELVACLEASRVASLSMIRTFHDFKLMQLSWIYDLNFRASFRILRERRYLERTTVTLPRDRTIQRLSTRLREYVNTRIGE